MDFVNSNVYFSWSAIMYAPEQLVRPKTGSPGSIAYGSATMWSTWKSRSTGKRLMAEFPLGTKAVRSSLRVRRGRWISSSLTVRTKPLTSDGVVCARGLGIVQAERSYRRGPLDTDGGEGVVVDGSRQIRAEKRLRQPRVEGFSAGIDPSAICNSARCSKLEPRRGQVPRQEVQDATLKARKDKLFIS